MGENIKSLPVGCVLQGNTYSYEIKQVLGNGTFSIVYLASYDKEEEGSSGIVRTTIPVIIREFFIAGINGRNNLMVTNLEENSLSGHYKFKFINKADCLKNLKHNNVVEVLECFEANGTAYCVTESFHKGSLEEKIENRGKLSENATLSYTRQICEALRFLHQHKILHMNLTPASVMLNERNEAVLTDFGLSKHYDAQGRPESSTSIGTGAPGYAPLEQGQYGNAGGLDVTVDIYALGAIMYKMLTGQCPPEATKILNDGFDDSLLRSLNINGRITRIIEKAMIPQKRFRFQSLEEVIFALNQVDLNNPSQPDDDATIFNVPNAMPHNNMMPQPDNNFGNGMAYNQAGMNMGYQNNVAAGNEPTVVGNNVQTVGKGNSGSNKVLIIIIIILLLAAIAVGIYFMFFHKKSGETKETAVETPEVYEPPRDYGNSGSYSSRSDRTRPVRRQVDTREFAEADNNAIRGADYVDPILGVNLPMVYVQGGSFNMGATDRQRSEAESDERPVRRVNLKSYYIGKYEVTQDQWVTVMGYNPSYNIGYDLPVENVSWNEAKDFCRRMSRASNLRYDLPTEAQWEFAARGGIYNDGTKYSGSDSPGAVAWYSSNSGNRTHSVGLKQSNGLGIYDMSGNVWEWCKDNYSNYSASDTYNPQGPSSGTKKVIRGGFYYYNALGCRVSDRGPASPSYKGKNGGFRVVVNK